MKRETYLSKLPMSGSVLIILLIITVAIAISQFGVILYFFNFIKKNELHDGAVKDAQLKSASVMSNAVDKATEIVAEAEKAQLEKVNEQGKTLEALSQNVKQSLESVTQQTTKNLQSTADQAEDALEKTSKQAENSYDEFLKKTESTLQALLTQDRTLLEQKTNQAITQTSGMFETFMREVTDQVRKELDQEIVKANGAVKVYKEERIAAMNEKVIDILEQVLLETLGKKLSLKDEGEFVYQALEQAKKEHAFS